MLPNRNAQGRLDPKTRDFYCSALTTLLQAGVPFLVGGAYAFQRYTGIERHTKDLDVFTCRQDFDRVLDAFATAGWRTEVTSPHWLGKAHCGADFVDVIFSSGNGLAEVDDEWFEHALLDEVLGIPVRICPAEEMIWQKSFIMERERFDGADVAHLLRACGQYLDWRRLLRRFGASWRVLLSHLVLFGFIYPRERASIPEYVIRDLTGRLERDLSCPPPVEPACQGTLLSRSQYLVDIEQWGYRDARLLPRGNMSLEETEQWTAAIDDET